MASHNLGLFAAIPAEIRAQIWAHLRPSTTSSTLRNQSPGQDALGVLRAGRQLSQEILFHLYEKETLDIYVEPVWSEWLKIENTHGASWSIANTRDRLYDVFSKLPYRKLRLLRISISAPEAGKEAQLISLSSHVRKLVRLLEQTNGLPGLEIHLLDSAIGKWAQPDGTPQDTITYEKDGGAVPSDYMTVLLPFFRLRNVPQVRILFPDDLSSEGDTFKTAEKVLERTTPFGSVTGNQDYWDDNNIQEMLDGKFKDLEYALDHLPGQDANMMRLERFMF
ncbi:hypothetical protein DL98DRAFT_579902 [Cadophora sp. DSE1049]|nr:hypothetical protein DL98DRAFT_579902 [Cadophora sp. DSE1049]